MKTKLYILCFIIILFFFIYQNLRFIKKTQYIQLKIIKNCNFKHLEGVPTHYAHLIKDAI